MYVIQYICPLNRIHENFYHHSHANYWDKCKYEATKFPTLDEAIGFAKKWDFCDGYFQMIDLETLEVVHKTKPLIR